MIHRESDSSQAVFGEGADFVDNSQAAIVGLHSQAAVIGLHSQAAVVGLLLVISLVAC